MKDMSYQDGVFILYRLLPDDLKEEVLRKFHILILDSFSDKCLFEQMRDNQ